MMFNFKIKIKIVVHLHKIVVKMIIIIYQIIIIKRNKTDDCYQVKYEVVIIIVFFKIQKFINNDE